MTAPSDRPHHRHQRVLHLAVAALATGLAAGVLTVAVAVTASDASAAATKPSYCATARAFDEYRGARTATVRALLGRALRVAPSDIVSTIRTMRTAHEPSLQFEQAKAVWSRYNTNNCCTCLGGPNAPHVLVSPEP